MGTKVREISWPDEYNDLKRIEELMICGICYEYIDTSVMTPCSHNYCSVCIRKYLHYKAQCPACFHVFFEKDLYINRAMDSIIQHYIKVREKLISLIENRVVYNKVVQQREQDLPSTPPIRPARNMQSPKSPKTVEKKHSEPKTPSVNTAFASTSKCNTSSPTTSRSGHMIPSIAKMFNTPKRKEVVQQSVVNIKTVSCPVCRVDISENHVNTHLDACLKREMAQETVTEKLKTAKRPPLPKLVLRVMKDAELRKKMKELGLSTQGDRKTLENRFTRYSVIYNAECDKLEPRAISELIRQCETEEKQERRMDSFFISTTTTNRLQIERNAQEEKIEEAQKNYRMANKSSFDKLIEEVKNRRKIEKSKLQTSEIASANPSSEVFNSAITENSKSVIKVDKESCPRKETDTVVNPSTSYAFENVDSDSDESCPLQHYKSDDPISILQNCNDSNSSVLESPDKKLHNAINQDEEVPRSPLLNTNTIRKKMKLSNKSLNKSSSSVSSFNTFGNKNLPEDQTAARELCNSIIEDFSFDMPSDDSSNEFVDKSQLLANKIKDVGRRETLSNDVLNHSKFSESNEFSKKAIHKKHLDNGNVRNDSVTEIVHTSVDFKEMGKQKEDSTLKEFINAKVEKENDASSTNENAQSLDNKGTVCRPLRKRNRPSRFQGNETEKITENENTRKESSHDSQDSETPDDTVTGITPDGSLKRRRGRPKTRVLEHPANDLQNPPKRPIRRRQVTSDHNHC